MVVYENQLEGLVQIINTIQQSTKKVRLYIRIHPNTFNTSPEFVHKIFSLQNDNVEVIPPNSPISSYKLLLESPKIISFGSTLGIEATFWGKPSINLGKSLYMNMDVTYNPNSHEETMNYIFNENLKPLPVNDNVYKYGFYILNYGEPYKYYQPINHEKGRYRNNNIGLLNETINQRIKRRIKSYVPNSILVFYNRISRRKLN